MRRISTVELKKREVINLCGGEKLGYACDFEIDADDGRILALIVTDVSFSLFGKKKECVIPWNKIECFGEDTILVKVSRVELCDNSCDCKKSKK